MNSLDPWRDIQTNLWDEVVVPTPFYGHSLYWDIPSWIHYGGGGNVDGGDYGTRRLLFDGAFIGAESPPATNIAVHKELDDKQVLHVEICVDGKCYRTSMNLAPVIAGIMKGLARWHEDIHAQASPTTVVGAVEAAVDEAGRSIVGALIGCHVPDRATTIGAFLPLALTAAAAAYGGAWWMDQSWTRRLRESAKRGESLYWNNQLIYVPNTPSTP
jgi:hypothetical protein